MVSASIAVWYLGRLIAEGQRMGPSQTTQPPLICITPAAAAAAAAGMSGTYSVLMVDRSASHLHAPPSSPLLVYVHYWAVLAASPAPGPSPILRILAPYQPPAPHDTLLHRYEILAFPDTPSTTAAPDSFLIDPASRYVPSLSSLQLPRGLRPLASTYFIEQLSTP